MSGSIGKNPLGVGSSWAGMSGAALFADDFLIGVVLVDAESAHPERLELWALPADTFADDPSFLHWIRWDRGEGRWSRSKETPSSERDLLKRIVESNEQWSVRGSEVIPKTKADPDKASENRPDARSEYYSWILKELDTSNPIDNKKATDYYIKNRAIELDVIDKINHKDNWNISDHEAEYLYRYVNNEWKLEDFLKSPREVIKVIAAPSGTGKTSFAKVTAQNMIINHEGLPLKDIWIPIYISLKHRLVSDYRLLCCMIILFVIC